MTKRQTRPETLHQKIIVGILVRSLLFYYFSLELSHFQYYEPIEEIVENQTIAPILGYYGRRLCQSNGLQFCLSNHPIRVDLLHSDWMICRSNASKMAPRQLPFHDFLFKCICYELAVQDRNLSLLKYLSFTVLSDTYFSLFFQLIFL